MTDSGETMDDALEKTKCKYHKVCERDEHATGIGYCILHDPDEEKDQDAFNAAFAEHRDMLRARRDRAKRDEGQDYRPRSALRDDFRWMVFPAVTDFTNETFPKEGVSFQSAIFTSNTDFCNTTFLGAISFRGSEFRDEAIFNDAEFKDTVKFNRTTFCENVQFHGATFWGDTKFSSAKFPDQVSFFGATFDTRADFSGARFSDTATFHFAVFNDTADFSNTTFHDTAYFRRTTFCKKTDFKEATFLGTANFEEATFGDKAEFSRGTFSGKIRFDQTTFDSSASFEQALFEGRTLFKGTHDQPLFSRDGKDDATVDFTNAEFHDRPKVRFLNVDLSRASFLHVDVREIEFTSIKWCKIEGGNGVYDEVTKRGEDGTFPYGALARLYRRLKQAYEDQRDYGRGGDFHYREKEMMRLDPNTSTRNRVILTLYRALSGYGERLRSGWFVIGLIAFYSVGGLWLGLEKRTEETWKPLPRDWGSWSDALAHSLQVILLRNPATTRPADGTGDIVQVLVMILGPLLIGLFALAIRQRVRR